MFAPSVKFPAVIMHSKRDTISTISILSLLLRAGPSEAQEFPRKSQSHAAKKILAFSDLLEADADGYDLLTNAEGFIESIRPPEFINRARGCRADTHYQ